MQEQENQLEDKRDANNVLGMNSDATFSRSKGIDQKCYNPMIQIYKGLFCGGREHVRRTTNVTLVELPRLDPSIVINPMNDGQLPIYRSLRREEKGVNIVWSEP